MAISPHTGWTAASILPSIASGYAPGSAWSIRTPAQVSGNPVSLRIATANQQANRAAIMARILQPATKSPTAKAAEAVLPETGMKPLTQPTPAIPGNQSPAANAMSNTGYKLDPVAFPLLAGIMMQPPNSVQPRTSKQTATTMLI